MKVAAMTDKTHNPFDEAYWVSCLRENLMSSSDGEGLETGRALTQVPRQSFTRQLLFKEWKSYANLHVFDTSNPHIAEGLIWASLCAATLKRYCAHMAQRITRVAMSTHIVAKCIRHVLSDMLRALMHQPSSLNAKIVQAMVYLSHNAQRTHPERDRRKGRLRLGLQHVYGAA